MKRFEKQKLAVLIAIFIFWVAQGIAIYQDKPILSLSAIAILILAWAFFIMPPRGPKDLGV